MLGEQAALVERVVRQEHLPRTGGQRDARTVVALRGRGEDQARGDQRSRHRHRAPERLGGAQVVAGRGRHRVRAPIGRPVREDGDGPTVGIPGQGEAGAAERPLRGPQGGAVLVERGEAEPILAVSAANAVRAVLAVSAACIVPDLFVAEEDPVQHLGHRRPPGVHHDHHAHLEREAHRGGVDGVGELPDEGRLRIHGDVRAAVGLRARAGARQVLRRGRGVRVARAESDRTQRKGQEEAAAPHRRPPACVRRRRSARHHSTRARAPSARITMI